MSARPPVPPLSGEERLIAQHFAPLARHPGALGLADDAAYMTPPEGSDLVLTKDAVVAGVHFFADDPPHAIARKALRVNLSDLAAKGATPSGCLLALALPADIGESWLAEFSRGLAEDADFYGCPLLGGDTVRSPGPLMISITAVGSLPHGTMVHRSGAGAGDRILLSGAVGDAALGLALRRAPELAAAWRLTEAEREHLLSRYLLPQPRMRLAAAVRAHASAAMDVSDGLAGDLAKLCRVSGASATIAVQRLPFSDAARKAIAADPQLLEAALTGGDDYEILCAVPEAKVADFMAAAAAVEVAVSEIGRVTAGSEPPRFVGADGQALAFKQAAFSHF